MPLSTSSQGKQLSDQNSAGTYLGANATDLIGFYENAGGVARQAGNAQAAMVRGQQAGTVATSCTSETPTPGITAQSTVETSLPMGITTNASTNAYLLATTDFVYVNKPTQQAGIGIGNARVSSTSQIAITFANFTNATVTATAGEKYGVVSLRGLPFITQTITPASVSAATTAEQLFTVTGVRVGEVVAVMGPAVTTNTTMAGVRVAANNQIGITFANTSPTTATTPSSGTYTIFSLGGLAAVGTTIDISFNPGASFGPTSSNVSSTSFTLTGLGTADKVMGLQKPTAQAGVAVGPAFTSGANALGVNFVNITATVTPSTFECWDVTVFRPNPVAPCIVYQQALTPSAVPPNTTTSQVFTLTGLINSSVVWVNKPSFQPGLGVMGARVSGTNQLEITFANASANTITPTAGETYSVANFQQAVPDVGTTWMFNTTPALQSDAILTNAIRAAMVAMNMIAGA